MNWKKINSNQDLPPFNKMVFLMKKNYDDNNKSEISCGKLKSIDANGANWVTNSMDIFEMFTISAGFKPTHWCDVEMPND